MRYLQLKKKEQLCQAGRATAGGKGGCKYLQLRLLGNQIYTQEAINATVLKCRHVRTTVLAIRAHLKSTEGTDSTLASNSLIW